MHVTPQVEVETTAEGLARWYARANGTPLSEERQRARLALSEGIREQQRQGPRSKPELQPEVVASDDGGYSGEPNEPLTRGVPRGTKTETVPSGTKTEEQTPAKRRQDDDFLVAGDQAIYRLARRTGKGDGDAMRYLAVGDGDLPAPKIHSRHRGEALYSVHELDNWADNWAARYKAAAGARQSTKEPGKERKVEPHFPAVVQASERFSGIDSGGDIDSIAAGARCFGDRERRRFAREEESRQDRHFLGSEYFRT
jgi:hypothetical protein